MAPTSNTAPPAAPAVGQSIHDRLLAQWLDIEYPDRPDADAGT